MKKTLLGITVAALALGSASMVIGQSRPQTRTGTAENKLVGISLYDTGAKVVSVYGSPDEIQGLTPGGQTTGGGAGGSGTGRGGAPGGRGSDGGGGAATLEPPPPMNQNWDNNGLIGDPFGPNTAWKQSGATLAPPTEGDDSGRGSGSVGAPAGGRAGGGSATGGGGGGGKVVFTRWVYKRNNSRYAFVLDKFNRVIQIEAIGMKNSSVKTRRGITFGSSFSSLIKAYNAPDSYEVNGDNLVVRFLVRDRVAFRLNRLQADKPQVVTGIVVAAAKT